MEALNEFFAQQHPVVPGIILALLIAVALFFSWSPWRLLIAHWRLHSFINKLGLSSLKNVYIPDGLDDVIYIEQLILRPDGLLFVTIKPFRGNIFAAKQIDQWTQVIGHHSYKFPNPIHQQEADLQALRGMVAKQPVTGMVVFAKGSQFPKGKPEGVCDYQELKQMSSETGKTPVSAELDAVWKDLQARSQPATNMKQKILYRDADRHGLMYGVISFIGAVGFAVWYMGYLIQQ